MTSFLSQRSLPIWNFSLRQGSLLSSSNLEAEPCAMYSFEFCHGQSSGTFLKRKNKTRKCALKAIAILCMTNKQNVIRK